MAATKIRKNGIVKELLAKAFPAYKGRSFRVNVAASLYFDPYGGGGTHSKFVLVDMATGRAAAYVPPAAGPFGDPNAYRAVPLAPNTVLVEHAVFQGHDVGVTFHVANGDPFAARLSPAHAASTVALPDHRPAFGGFGGRS